MPQSVKPAASSLRRAIFASHAKSPESADGDRVVDTLLDVVSIHEQRAVFGKRLRVGAERLKLRGKRHDPRVGVRARHGEVEHLAREHVRSRRAAAHDARARRPQAAARALGTAQAELGHGRTLRRKAHARGLGRNERLEVHAVEKRRLEQLALHNRALDAHEGLIREHDLPLGHGIDIDRQLEVAQPFQEIDSEQRAAARSGNLREIVDVLAREGVGVHHVRKLRHAACDGIAPFERGVTEIHMEACLGVLMPGIAIALSHRDLVQVR